MSLAGTSRSLYQLTDAASKGNAFCWLGWESPVSAEPGGDGSGDANAKPASKVERMRKALETGPKNSAYLADLVGLKDRTTVYSYLRHHIRAGTIASHRGTFSLTIPEKKAA